MPQAIVPGSNVKIQSQSGGASTEYLRFFGNLPGVGKPAAISGVALGGSPFQYVASVPGFLSVSGGTVSAITLTRNGAAIPIASPVPMSNGDAVTVTYSVAPSINFVPS